MVNDQLGFKKVLCYYGRMHVDSGYIRSRIKVNPETKCWIWQRSLTTAGYGQACYQGKKIGAHRLSYQFFKGNIPVELEIDHLCRTPKCVNPDHLEAVTPRENQKRAYRGRDFRGRYYAR
jgi:hypothetical protein